MKKSIVFIIAIALLMQKGFANQNVSSVIKQVTVYQQYAKVNHVASANIQSGNSELILENLTDLLIQNSLQVQVKGGATLLSASFQTNYLKEQKKMENINKLKDSLQILTNELLWIEMQRKIYIGEEQLLTANNKLGSDNQGLTITELKMLTEFYRTKSFEIKELLLKLDKKNSDIQHQKNRIENQLSSLNALATKPTGEIVLNIVSNVATKITIEFSYLTSGAGWYPIYDLRATSVDKPLKLVYKANVYQNSGYDWKDIKLSISTGNPSANNDRPILHPLYVDYYSPQIYSNMLKSRSVGSAPAQMMQAESNLAYEDKKEYDAPAPEYVVNTNENQLNVEYDIELVQDIPSDNKVHLVSIKDYELPAEYKYHAVPKLSDGAFLLAKVTDYGKYNLLPGTANIFFEGMYIGQSEINPQTSSDTLLLSLGRDDKIIIKRTKLQDLTSKKMIGSNTKEIQALEIQIRNNKNTEIPIEILDQFPISNNKDIEVELTESSNARVTADYGKVLWDLKIAPAQTEKLRFIYTVKYPNNKQISRID